MSDITKCSGEKCPLKEKCYRYTAKADEYGQAYFIEVPFDKEKNECEHYWK